TCGSEKVRKMAESLDSDIARLAHLNCNFDDLCRKERLYDLIATIGQLDEGAGLDASLIESLNSGISGICREGVPTPGANEISSRVHNCKAIYSRIAPKLQRIKSAQDSLSEGADEAY